MTESHPPKDIGSAVAEGYRAMGPLEASMLARAAAIRNRLRGPDPAPKLRQVAPLQLPKPPAIVEPVLHAPRLATSKGRALVVEVAKANGIGWRELVGEGRSQRLVIPRNEVAFRLVTEFGMSYAKAGRVLGGRDHTTILYGCRNHAKTSPEAAEVWRKHVECETEQRSHKRDIARRLHEQGVPVGQIASRLHVMPGAVKRWIA